MFMCKEVFLLAFALSALTSENRVKRQMVKQVRGGVKPSEAVPTAVAILINNYPSCSGTILSNTWVATAGHCFENVPALNLEVVAGVVSLLSNKAVRVGVKRIIKHPSYKIIENDEDGLKVLDWDLALLELKESLEIDSNEMISEAKLPPPAIKHHGKPITIGGWGRTDQFSPPSLNHLSINVTIKTTEECSKTHPVSNFHEDRMFCAGTESETTCPGDSGSGAIYYGWEDPVLLGVVSFGREGCKTSTVYTKVDKFLPWIYKQTKIRFMIPADKHYEEYFEDVADHCSGVCVEENLLYLGGTNLVEMPSFRPAPDCIVPPHPWPGVAHAFSGIVNGKIIVCGGFSWDYGRTALGSCFLLVQGAWQKHHELITGRYEAAASMTGAGWMVTGGWAAGGTILSSSEILTADGWVPGPPLPKPLIKHCQVRHGDKTIVAGGRSNGPSEESSVYILTGTTWATLKPMGNHRYSHSCSILNNRLVVMGSYQHWAGTSVETFDFEQNSWSGGPDLPSSFWDGYSLVLDCQLYALFGKGEVVRMAEDRNTWDTVAQVGRWWTGRWDNYRPLQQAVRVTKQMIGC